MPVIIEQGKNKIFAQPGVVVGISEEKNTEIRKNQLKHFRNEEEYTTLMIMEDDELNDIMDELLTDADQL